MTEASAFEKAARALQLKSRYAGIVFASKGYSEKDVTRSEAQEDEARAELLAQHERDIAAAVAAEKEHWLTVISTANAHWTTQLKVHDAAVAERDARIKKLEEALRPWVIKGETYSYDDWSNARTALATGEKRG